MTPFRRNAVTRFTNNCNIIEKHSLSIIIELATHLRPGFGTVAKSRVESCILFKRLLDKWPSMRNEVLSYNR